LVDQRANRWSSTLTGLRQDRILEEATAAGTRDPMHLASMFGLHPNTAQRYIDAVYGRRDPAPSDGPVGVLIDMQKPVRASVQRHRSYDMRGAPGLGASYRLGGGLFWALGLLRLGGAVMLRV
jgi:hypothetical protein